MQIGLNIFVTARPLPDEGMILPQLVSDPSVTGNGLEGTSLVADATDVWTYDNVQANVAERQYRLLIDGGEVDGPQSEETVSIPPNTVGSSYLMQLRVQVTAAQGVWSAWQTISGGTVTGLPVLISATGTATGETSYDGTVTTDTGDGILYWAVTGTATAPAISVLKSAESQAISSAGQQDVTGNGLSPDSSYHIHFIQEDGAGLDSNIISTSAFVTNAPQATDPAAFGAGDWSISDLASGGDARVIVTALPDDGGDALKTIEYRIAAGAWTPLSVAATGSYDLLDLFTDGSPTDVRLRATNLVGAGPDGVAKSVTTTPAATVPAAFGAGDWSISDLATGGDASVIVTALPGDGGSAITGIEYLIGSGAWVALGGGATGSYDLLDLFTDGSPTDVRLRAVNAIGTGAPSDVKSITTSAPSPTEISITGATFTAGGTAGTGAGFGPSLAIQGDQIGGTANYTLYGATHASGTTLTKAQIVAGTGSATNAFTVTAAAIDGLNASPTLTTSLTNGHLSLFIRDSAGTPVESDITQIDGVNVDATAATLSSAIGTNSGATTATWSVTSDEAVGIVYAGVRPTGASALTSAQLIAGSGGAGVDFDSDTSMTADGANAGSFTGLTENTAYKVDIVAVDDWGNVSAVVSSAEFTTAAAASGPLASYVDRAQFAAAAGSSGVYTTGSVNLGVGEIYVAVSVMSGSAISFTSLVVDGVTATAISGAQRFGVANLAATKFYRVNCSSATGTIALTLTANTNGKGVVMYWWHAGTSGHTVTAIKTDDIGNGRTSPYKFNLNLNTAVGGSVLASANSWGNSGLRLGGVTGVAEIAGAEYVFSGDDVTNAYDIHELGSAEVPRTVGVGPDVGTTESFTTGVAIALEATQ